MKLKSFITVLLVILMVFAFAGCKNEPKQEEPPKQQEPQTPESKSYDKLIWKLTATKGRADGWFSYDKFRLNFSDASDAAVNLGDVFSIKFRSTTEFYEFNVRNGSGKWVYEDGKEGLTSYSEPDADGWITITYEFVDTYYDASEVDFPEEFIFDFIGDIVPGDILEVKEIKLNDKYLGLEASMVEGYASPEFEETEDATWNVEEAYAVFYFDGDPNPDGSSYRTPKYEVVKTGQSMTMNLEKEGFTLKMYDTGPDSSYRKFDFTNPPEESLITKDISLTYNTKIALIYTENDPE